MGKINVSQYAMQLFLCNLPVLTNSQPPPPPRDQTLTSHCFLLILIRPFIPLKRGDDESGIKKNSCAIQWSSLWGFTTTVAATTTAIVVVAAAASDLYLF